MAQLRASLVEAGEAVGESADRRVPRIAADRRAVERAVRGEAIDNRLDIALIQRRRVAHEQILDRQPVFQIARRHSRFSGYSIGMKSEWRILPSRCCDR